MLVYLNAASDRVPSNNPSRNNFKWERSVNGLPIENPTSLEFTLAPGETRTLFNGVRTLLQDNTTEYSVAPTVGLLNNYQLTWVGGTAPQFRTPRTSGANATTQVTVTVNGPVATFTAPSISATFASFTGQIPGMTTNVTITANNLGVIGNSVVLTADGTSNISTLITAWNTANLSNQITLTSGDGTQIPTNGGTIHLSGGVNAATPFNLLVGGVMVGDFVRIGNLFNLQNQGEWQIISVAATNFSVVNYGAVAEGPYVLGSGFASQIDIYSAAGVQVNDTLVISGGFSPVTQGSYIITAVSDGWVRFSSTSVLPTEGPITTEAITIYSDAQRLVYLEADQHVAMTLNGITGNELEPLISPAATASGCGSCPRVTPGIFMRTSVVYSMSVTNVSESTANLFFAAIE